MNSCTANASTADTTPSMQIGAGFSRALQRLLAAPGAVAELIGTWFERIRYRNELYELSDKQMADMGIDRATLLRETSKPFWID